MYGYVVVNKPEMKFKEYDEYRAYYCGLCHSLKERYGISGQISLSYDFTFLALLLSGLYEPQERREMHRCAAHPLSHRNMVKNEYVQYASDMSVLLAWHKCRDDWEDEHDVVKKLYGSTLTRYVADIRKKYPEKCSVIEIGMKNICEAEKRREKSLDVMAGYFGKIMAEVMAVKEDIWEESLRIMGFHLGKFVYILDAYDDLEKDRKKGNYNPLLRLHRQSGFEEEVGRALKICAALCAAEFEKLPIVENASILRNILYSGIWTRYELIQKKRKEKDGSV